MWVFVFFTAITEIFKYLFSSRAFMLAVILLSILCYALGLVLILARGT